MGQPPTEAAEGLVLRDYQQRSKDKTYAAMRTHRKVLMVAPTGAGKRVMLCDIAIDGVNHGKRIMVVTDRRTLVTQMADECSSLGIEHGIIMGNEPRRESAQVQVASIQTLKRRNWKDTPDADLIAIDEAHKASKAYHKLFEHYPNAKVLGVTATPVGSMGKALAPSMFDVMVEGAINSELITAGHILPTRCWCPSEPNMEGVTVRAGDYASGEMQTRVQECFVFANIFDYWHPFSHMQTIVFAPRVVFARSLAEEFTKRGFPAAVIEAATLKKDRSDIFKRFANRELRILVSVDVLREGFDAPIAQCGIDLQPTKQFRTYAQKVGRVRRSYPGQNHALWLDFAGNFWRFYHPDEDPDWESVTEDASIQDLIDGKKPKICKVCGKGCIIKNQCSHCGMRTDPPKEPWKCPVCHYSKSPWEKILDGKCPQCGHVGEKGKRRIKMENSDQFIEVPLEAKQSYVEKRRTKGTTWSSYLFKGSHCNWTLRQARREYVQDHGDYPRGDDVPPPMSGDWDRKINEMYPGIANHTRKHRRKNR